MTKRTQGFCVHGVMTSTLRELAPDARAAILGSAFALTFDIGDYKMPRRYEAFMPLAKGIATEARRLIDEADGKPKPKTGAQRTAEYRARKHAESETASHADVTKVTQCDGRDGVTLERMNERMNECESVSSPTPTVSRPKDAPTDEEVTLAAMQMEEGADKTESKAFAAYFVGEMGKTDWKVLNREGRAYAVTRINFKAVLRSWWNHEKKSCAAREGGGALPPQSAYTVGGPKEDWELEGGAE